MKVSNIIGNAGNPVKNQFIITDDYGNRFFQSYESIIAKISNSGKVSLDSRFWNFSVTTRKYRNIFLRETKKETEKKIASGLYTLCDLNNPQASLFG